MGLNGILSGALTSLQANTTALKVVSQNISNLNTDNYARRVVDFSALGAAGTPVGVTVEDVQRVSDQYLTQETLSATASSNQYSVQSSTLDQINTLLGSPGDGQSLTTKLQNIFSSLGSAQLSTNSSTSQTSVVNSMKSLASTISSLSSSLDSLSSQTDSQLSNSVSQANTLIKQIYDYNQLIKNAAAHGTTDTTYLDQRDQSLNSLSKLMDVRVSSQDDGSMLVTTQDGVNLVSDSYATLSYTTGGSGNYGTIKAQDTNGQTGNAIGTAVSLDSHLTSGSMRGLIDLRDTTIAGLKNEVGSFAQTVANSFNAVHNANSSYPAPTTMDGRNTGLVGSDALNFSGQSTVTLTDSSGASVGSFTVDLSSLSTVDDLTSALDSGLSGISGSASASFSDGVLSLNGGNYGIVITNPDSTDPGEVSGTGLSQYFGLNDLFTTSTPSITATGLQGSDSLNLSSSSGGTINFVIKNSSGDVATNVNVAIDQSDTVDSAISKINSALGNYGSMSLNSDGSISTTLASKYSTAGYNLQVASDSTQRGTTGISFTQLFGIGANSIGNQANNFSVKDAILSDPSRIALGTATTPSSTGDQVISSGNSSGLVALQGIASTKQSFSKAGSLAAQSATLGDYAASVYQDIATKSSEASSNKTTQADRLTEAQSRMSSSSGVNLDEELSNMIIYQRAYSASARLMTTVGELYDTLLNIQ